MYSFPSNENITYAYSCMSFCKMHHTRAHVSVFMTYKICLAASVGGSKFKKSSILMADT